MRGRRQRGDQPASGTPSTAHVLPGPTLNSTTTGARRRTRGVMSTHGTDGSISRLNFPTWWHAEKEHSKYTLFILTIYYVPVYGIFVDTYGILDFLEHPELGKCLHKDSTGIALHSRADEGISEFCAT